MAEKRILIADADAKAQVEFRQALGDSWEVVGAATGNAALEEARKQPFYVIVANYDLPDINGAELLNQFRTSNPKTLRFIAAAEARKENVMADIVGGHQFLSIPFDGPTLKASIERSVTTDYGMSNSLRELVSSIRTFPTIPSLYVEVANALKDPNVSTEKVGSIIGRDMAMTTKLVQVLNSAYFGLPRVITDPTEAVGILGFETVKSLIMTVKLLSQHDKVKPVYFSIDNIWKHSTNVARTARIIALLETGDNDCASLAYTGGLMHDLGKVILAANFDGQYHGAHNVARKQQLPLWEVEKDIFGASHGEIGAYLLGLWGMSEQVVNVAAMHHHPMRAGDTGFTALTAVHAANALEYEGTTESDGLVNPVLDVEYLRQLGLEERVDLWRAAKHDPEKITSENKVKRAKSPAKPVAQAPLPVAASSARKPADVVVPLPAGQAQSSGSLKWVGIGLGIAAAVIIVARLQIANSQNKIDKQDSQKVAAAAPIPVRQEPVATVTTPKVVETPKPAPAIPTNTPVVAAVTPPAAPVAAPTPAPVKTALDKLELQAIFYSADHPSALISGNLAYVNDEVSKCRVLDISTSSVTMQYLDKRRTLKLR
ncbi:MAG TPA: response regulator [Verrucomicrobiae bacterium]|jgi:putative nucleotidyltransferase with HDIG domain